VTLELGGHCEITKSENQIKCEQLSEEIQTLQQRLKHMLESDVSKRAVLENIIKQLNDILRKFS
jgi:transcriptional regulator NrdR family protein